jgi:MYXO-CTERM domain-containing protein
VKLFLICVASITGLAGIGRAEAAAIQPTSYAYEFTPGGATVAYQDSSLTKLTDGLTGSTNAEDDSWVGFVGDRGQSGEGVFFFNFASSVTITDVSINFLRHDGESIELPPSVTVSENGGAVNNSNDFFPTNFSIDDTEGFVDFDGSWTGNQLIVALGQTDHFAFINEVVFNPTAVSATPEPGTAGLALAGLAAAIGWGRRRKYSTR